jgi:hypothetical protein
MSNADPAARAIIVLAFLCRRRVCDLLQVLLLLLLGLFDLVDATEQTATKVSRDKVGSGIDESRMRVVSSL